ncbi:GTPase Era [Candidatus Gillettellia adelgis]
MSEEKKYCGLIVIVGRANVGKSTLLNQLLGQTVSITSRKPQTTRQSIIGIQTVGTYQAIYVDTPGTYIIEKGATNRLANHIVSGSINDAKLVILVTEGTNWNDNDERIMSKLRRLKHPVLLAINKIDKITNKSKLLSYIAYLSKKMNFLDIVPISAKKQINLNVITNTVHQLLPEAEHHFPKDYITDRSQRFMASEIIREKLMRFLGAELPYSVMVKIERFVLNKYSGYHVHGLLVVQRDSQKKIVIGKTGRKIKTISTEARQDMEKIFNAIVHLTLWVQVNPDYTGDQCA